MSEFNKFYFSARLYERKGRMGVWKQIAKFINRFTIGSSTGVLGTVVDLGCGHGDFLRFTEAKRKIGVDVHRSPEFPTDAEFVKSSSSEFYKHVKSADAVFASNLLEHLKEEELEGTLSAVRKALKKDGLFIVLQPNFRLCYRTYFDDYTHRRAFTDRSLPDYLGSRGFEIVRVYPRFLPASMKSRLPKSQLLTWLYLRSPYKPFAGQMLVVAKNRK